MRYLILCLCAFTAACSNAAPTAPGASLIPGGGVPSPAPSANAAQPSFNLAVGAQPHFNLTAILRGDGFGHVKLRQEKDPAQDILYMDVWVRDLLPNASYSLQRAVDGPRDGVCTGTNWLTMGQGLTPQPILTDESGTGRAELFRAVPATATPSDIHFRVIQTGTTNIPLHSDCFQLLVRD